MNITNDKAIKSNEISKNNNKISIDNDNIDFLINDVKVMTINEDEINMNVNVNKSETILHTGDLIMRSSKLYFNDAINTSNYITYKSSNIIDITAGTEIELNAPLINLQNNLILNGNLLKIEGEGQRNLQIYNTANSGFSVLEFKVGNAEAGFGSGFQMGATRNTTGTTDHYYFGRSGISSNDLIIKNDGNIEINKTLTTTGLTVSSTLSLPNNSITNTMINNLDIAKVNFTANTTIETDLNIKSATNPTLSLYENTDEQLRIYHNAASNANYFNSKNSHPLIFDINEVEIFRANTNGLTMNGSNQLLLSTLNIRSGGGLYALSNSDMDFYTSSAKRMIIESNGNLTVGNTSQNGTGEKLTVIGSIKCDNIYTTKGVVDAGQVELGNTHYIKIEGNTSLLINENSFTYSDHHHCDILNTNASDSILTIKGYGNINNMYIYVNDTAVTATIVPIHDYTFKKKSKIQFWVVKTSPDELDIYIHTMS